MDWSDLLEAVFGGGSAGGGGEGLSSAWHFGLAQVAAETPVIGQYLGFYLTGREDLSDLTDGLDEFGAEDSLSPATIGDEDNAGRKGVGDWGDPLEQLREEDPNKSRSPWFRDENRLADNSGAFAPAASYQENQLDLRPVRMGTDPGVLGATLEDDIPTVYIRAPPPDRTKQFPYVPSGRWWGPPAIVARPQSSSEERTAPSRTENAAPYRIEEWASPPPQVQSGSLSIGDWLYQDSKGGWWLPPEKGDLLTLMQPIDTGSTVQNYLANTWISISNIAATFINVPFEMLSALDDQMRRTPFSQEWEASQTMLPMMRTMGLAVEGSAAMRYLQAWLSTDRGFQRLAGSFAMSFLTTGGLSVPDVGLRTSSSSSVRARFMQEMLDIIVADDKHPLRFLIDPKTRDWVGRSHLADAPTVQAGHLESRWFVEATGAVEHLAVEDAFKNQWTNWMGETGRQEAVFKEAVLVKGVYVETRSLKLWADMKPGLAKYLKAERVLGWTDD